MQFWESFWKSSYRYFAGFLTLLVLGESVLRYEAQGKAFFGASTFLIFLPAIAAALTVLSGFFKERRNYLWNLFIVLTISFYYVAQCIYFGNFGSFFSVSLMGIGVEAVGNFWWVILDVLKRKGGDCLVILLPLILLTAGGITKKPEKEHIDFTSRVVWVLLTAALTVGGFLVLKGLGTERGSAYYNLTNTYANTDSSAESIGVLPTSLVEAKVFFGNGKAGNESTKITIVTEPALPGKPDSEKTDISENSDTSNNSQTVEEENPEFIYHVDADLDFTATKTSAENEAVVSVCDYLEAKQPEAFNEYTGMLEGYNLIYICGESFNTISLHEKITPLLCEMAESGIVLSNYYTSYMNTTTNGEFALVSSLWADTSRYAADGNSVGSFARSADNYMPYGLGTLFAGEGVPTFAYHGYIGSYYRREESWPNLGFENIKFMHDGMEFINKYSPGDTELMEQSVSDYVGEERFMTYYMTFSGHGSYSSSTYMYLKNNEAVRLLLAEDGEYTEEEIAWYCGSYELEMAMEYLVEELEKAGQLNNTLIVLAGDHMACSLSDEAIADISTRQGIPYDKVFEQYHSTAIIYSPSIEKPIVNDNYCCNVDILPTVLNLMGISYDSRLFAGNDVFGEGLHRARLYNGNIITEYVRYNASNGSAEWSEAGKLLSDEEKEIYLGYLIDYTESEYVVSTAIVDSDFYRLLWDASGK